MNKVNVFMCLRNNENSLDKTFTMLEKLKEINNNYKFYFYIYENDSIDNTKNIIRSFYDFNNGKCKFEILDKVQWNSDNKNHDRITDMSLYRNKMKTLCTNWEHSEYSIILD